jgi:hypothetical protein
MRDGYENDNRISGGNRYGVHPIPGFNPLTGETRK